MVARTVLFAMTQGLSMGQISAVTGLSAEDLADPDGWLPETAVPAVWRLLAQACPGRAIALEMAASAPFSFFGPLAYTCRSAGTLRSLLHAFVRYRFALSDRLHIELVEQPPEALLRMHHPMDAEDGGHGAEMGLALGARFGRELMAEPALVRVELSHAPLGPLEAYEEMFRVPVLFRQPHNAMVLRSDGLDWPTRTPDPELFRFIQRHLDLARERLATTPQTDQMTLIREAIAHNAERSEYGAEALARQMGTSLRNLQRLTRAQGTSVRALLDEARMASARELLGDPRLSVEEVSFLLGYSEDRAFRRAFERCTGQTPAQLRRAMSR